MPPKTTSWPIEEHTRSKHIILRRYLQAWFPIITSWNGRVVYIDGFAGPGIYEGGETGSPIIALTEAIAHGARIKSQIVFIFIEADPDRHAMLTQQVETIKKPPNMQVHCLCATCDEKLTQLLDFVAEQKKSLAPTFAFLDPFGISHTPFSLVRRLMQNKHCEVFITFMYEEINRFLSQHDLPKHFDALFGCPLWQQGIPLKTPQERKKFIHDLYLRQLKEAAKITYVRSFEMLNRGNRTDYFLFFGTNNYEGLKKMKEAMWKADDSGGIQFSDATDLSQSLLFEGGPDFAEVKNRIVARYKGKEVSVDDIERFVVIGTPYRETHFKTQVLKPMEVAAVPELQVIRRTGTNRRGTFPPGTMIKIL